MEPGRQFVPGWHIDAIADHLQACIRGQIRRLVINIPPRHMKSISAAVDLAPWTWVEKPHTQFAYFSYAHNLSLRDSVKARRLIQSYWYQDRFGTKFALTGDQNAKHRFENDHNGYRLTSSIGGLGTGEGGDIIVCFPAGTLVSTARGQVPIELVRLGESVWSSNEAGQLELKPVTKCYTSAVGRHSLVELKFSKGPSMRCTPNHPIWIRGQGWVEAGKCQAYDLVALEDRTFAMIERVTGADPVFQVHNLEVADNHTYFANGILVHNCDDPHNVREAESDVVRQGVIDWWDDTMQTRLNDPKTGVFIVIMQRVHALDLSGHILKERGYDHLCLPAEYEKNHPFPVRSSIGFKDPRTKEGEPLWKDRFDTQQLLELKMTAYARAGQLQQRPSPRGGSILLEKWWRKWDLQKFKMPRFTGIYQSYDCAMTEEDRENASYSARTTWGTFEIDGQPQVMLLDRWRDRVPYYELRKEAKRSFKQFKPDTIVVENKVAGISLIQDLRMAGLPVVKYTPDRDKDARAHSASILLETGKVWYIDATWSKDVINWCAAFPAGDGEDIVDTVTQLLIRLRNQWFIIPGDVENQIEEDDEDKPTPKPRRAVYG